VVDISYGGIRGLVVAASVHICSDISPGGVWSRGKVWHRKAMHCLHIPLPEHVGRSLLRHPKKRSGTLDGGTAVKVVHWLG
jgi:hypothetical protein